VASRRRRATPSSTRWCATPPTRACSGRSGSGCTPASPARSRRYPRTEPELLARHYTGAGLGEPAVRYWLEAARRAAGRSANAEAVAHLRKGLTALPLLPATDRERTELDFRIALGTCLVPLRGYTAPETAEAFARARELCDRLGDTPHLTTALFGHYLDQVLRADLGAALATAEQLLERGRGLRDATATLLGHRAAGVTLTHLGDLSRARAHLERALALYDPPAHGALASTLAFDPAVPCHAYLARCDPHAGRPDRAAAHVEAALSIAGRSGHLPTLGFALWQQAALRCELGDRRGTRETVERLLPLTREEGYSVWAAMAVAVGGWAIAEEGDLEAACAEIRRGLGEWQARGQRMTGTFLHGLLADTLRRAGRPGEALGELDAAVGTMEATGERLWEPELYRLKGETLAGAGDVAAAEYQLTRALDVARKRERGGALMALRAGTSLARLWVGRDRRREACDLLAPIRGRFAEGCDMPDLRDAKALLDVLR
jgi:predicted ATPase